MSSQQHHPYVNRRYFFFGSLAIALGCSRPANNRLSAARQTYPVSIVRASSYSVDLESLVRNVLLEHRLSVAGKNVLLKPNLVEFSAEAPVNTNPIFVAAVEAAFRSLGAAKVHIAEGPGHRRTTLDLASAAGYFGAIPSFEQNFTDLNLDEIRRVRLKNPFSTLTELYLPQTALGYDLLVSLPKMKTHHWTGATLSMKNLFGLVPGAVYGWPKNILHWAGIDECVADLHFLFPRQFCLVDGIEAMDGNGPILGNSVWAGVIVGGAHPPSVDATCCQVMQIDPERVRYLQLVAMSSGWRRSAIRQIGEPVKNVTRRFNLLPELEHLRLRNA